MNATEINCLRAEVERLRAVNAHCSTAYRLAQEAVDTAYGALVGSAYVGGPTEREAWQAAMTALGAVATQNQGRPASDEQGDRL